ncbi:MAG TPA: hydroxyacid dehydrogenase [Stellaceae bacterium]|jgi:D-3-phosphoglycerate dehydrogenase|nr:hydroxyacid dehydrogenase [Stellaceae bacterium]
MATNIKKLLLPITMAKAGWAIVEAREDVEGVPYDVTGPKAELHKLLEDAAGVALSVQPFSDPELDAGRNLEVVARIGVGYDAVDVPALTRRKVPLMIAGTANSVTVAEAGIFLMMSLARKGAYMDTMVKEGRWRDRYSDMPVDMYAKTVLVVGFGKIGSRSAKRLAALETNVLVYDPYTYSETIRGMGYEPVADLDEAVARADFITIHCPKTPETTGMFNAARLAKMKKTAYLVNTARGGIVDEKALHDVLTRNQIAGAALDVFETEPTPADNPLLKLKNFIAAPHMAGVTSEAVDRMAIVAVQNMLSVIDGKPIRDNVINREVLD